MRYLLAAEADKIQEFIFRSSRLREVVGASQLLSRFCREGAPPLLREQGGNPDTDILVNDGGSFRVVFGGPDAEAEAQAFGANLAELYRLSVGSSLSVAQPQQWNGLFQDANDQASQALRQAKNHWAGATYEVHMPYVAFCASCGVTLANHHGRLSHESGGRTGRYLCQNCRQKAAERWTQGPGNLHDFLAAVIGAEDQLDRFVLPDDADTVARYDLRKLNYVAYLVADGNGMGSVFGKCNEAQIKKLSDGLTEAVRRSLAKASGSLIARLDRKHDKDDREIVPVLPLILGGDDLFALIPAPYALDFARSFCLAWEEELRALLVDKVGLTIGTGKNEIVRPTVAAAVVICKSKYPYALAHKRADELLKEAKRQSKLLAPETGEQLSAVNFEVILGNRLAGMEEDDAKNAKLVRRSLRPYWVSEGGALSAKTFERGIDLYQLITQRYELKNVPNKRLNDLQRRFESLTPGITASNRTQQIEKWMHGLEIVLRRSGPKHEPKLRAALTALGKPQQDGSDHPWRILHRDDKEPLAHGMLDLLEAWDFAQDLKREPQEYEPEEDE